MIPLILILLGMEGPAQAQRQSQITTQQKMMIVIDNTQSGRAIPKSRARIFTIPGMALAEVRGKGAASDILFSNNGPVAYLINHQAKTVMTVTRATIEKAKQVLANLPKPDDLKKIYKDHPIIGRLIGVLNHSGGLNFRYERVQSGVQIGNFTCDLYRGSVKAFTLEHCMTDWSKLGFDRSYVLVLKQMYQFLTQLSFGVGGSVRGTDSIGMVRRELAGLSVLSKSYVGKNLDHQVQVQAIHKAKYNPAQFQIPGNYKRVEFPTGG